MAILFSENSPLDAWLAVSKHLLKVRSEESNVLVTINDPLRLDKGWLERYSPHVVSDAGDKIADVIDTIFPRKTWKNAASKGKNRLEFYDRYKRAHSRSRNRRWGTYFLRLVNFGDKHENQLENAISALNSWKNNPQAALTLHLSSPETDSLRPLGAPCWHFGELLCPDKSTVNLTVVYRNHDYFNKAFGNFLGLAKLLDFVAQQTNRKPGQIVCHSVRAYYQANKGQFEKLIA